MSDTVMNKILVIKNLEDNQKPIEQSSIVK